MKLLRPVLLLPMFLTLSAVSFAQQNSTAPVESISVSAEKPPKVSTSNASVLLGWKSYNSSGRMGYLQDDVSGPSKGQVYNGKQEVYLGYRFENEWGGFVQLTQVRQQYNDSNMNRWSASDPSLTLLHPALFDNGSARVLGQFRVYLPVTDRSKNMNIRQLAYYSTQIFALGDGQEIFNQVIPRYFAADKYNDADTTWLLENRTIYTKKINSWCKLGLGNWLQVEKHSATATGVSSEVIPQVDFLFSKNITFGPRISLPIYAQNAVYDGPRGANLNEARGELFFQATL